MLSEGAATDVSSNLFQLSRQVAEQYVAPWGQCLRLVLPPASKPRAEVSHYELTAARASRTFDSRALLGEGAGTSHASWKKPSGLRRSSRSPGPADLLHDLKARGWVAEIQALPLATMAPFIQPNRPANQDDSDISASLTPDPAMSWAEPLFEALKGPGSKRVLVQAPSSDRLKLLQRAIRLVLDRRQTVLIIVGETERAQWVAGLIRNDEAGISPVCFHSGLSDQLKSEMWDQIHRQAVRVIVGTRSTVFLPLTAIGVIWVEGEDDAALEEPQEPRYHAREVAWLRAQGEQAVLVLSSPHPSLETKAAVEQRGILVRNIMPSNARPNVQVVELRDYSRGTVLSQPLVQAIGQAIGRRAGVLLFLNRKGYAGALICLDCGQVPRCPTCHVALMYSRQAARLSCSYCGRHRLSSPRPAAPVPDLACS